MKRILILVTVLLSVSLAAQTTSSQTPATTTKPHQHKQMGAMAKSDHDKHGMMEKCMDSMAKQLPAAEKTLAEMKTALGQMSSTDPAAKHFAELSVQMWEAEVNHMKEMATMHSEMKEKMKTSHEMKENEQH